MFRASPIRTAWPRFIPACVFAVVIFYFTHIPGQNIPSWMNRIGNDKVLHILAYSGFCLLLFLGVDAVFRQRLFAAAAGIGMAALLAATDELTQGFTGRSVSFRDFLASTSGAFIGTVTAVFLATLIREVRREPGK